MDMDSDESLGVFLKSISTLDIEIMKLNSEREKLNDLQDIFDGDGVENNVRKLHPNINFVDEETPDLQLAISQYENTLKRISMENFELDEDLRLKTANHEQLLASVAKPQMYSEPIELNGNKNSVEQSEKLKKLSIEQQRNQALIIGAERIQGIQLKHVEGTEKGGLQLFLAVQNIKATIILDENKKLNDVQISQWFTSSSNLIPTPEISSSIPKFITESKTLPQPQDLRHMIFCLNAMQYAATTLHRDIFLMRQKHLIHVSRQSPLQLQATFSNGITATMNIHECYSSVPNGVYFEELQGGVDWNKDALNVIRRNINAKGLMSISFAIECLFQELEKN